MSSWSGKRRSMYLLVAVGIVIAAVSIPIFLYVNRPETCTDGLKNQNEENVDCGGVCTAVCQTGSRSLVVDWARAFKVGDGLYDLGALIENADVETGAKEAVYHFKLYDDMNVLVAERFGKTFVLPGSKWVIFEGNINTGERTPRHAFIEFSDTIAWMRVDTSAPSVPDVGVRDQVYIEREGKPRLTATLVNRSPFPVENIEVVALLSGADDTAIGVSRTIIPRLEKYGSVELVFTWRGTFDTTPVKIDIIPRVNYIASPAQ
ncbi:MAG: hypothetical protein HGB03_00265 [Candidatus Yonathbacteria bacterium]|nr:hypothetical protein [Candidatus Yonathbacteria bacterium]NTW48112.1 hypothetical protein [Candidatus Yonathbacteria bacterium]